MTKNWLNKTYKFLEKDSDDTLIKLFETFVALLRGRPSASREDVELYFRKYDGLYTAMNKVNPRNISGANGKIYTKNLNEIKGHFREGSDYHNFTPYLDFTLYTNAMIALTVEEKEIEAEIHTLEESIKIKEKEIDEIETFKSNVHEVIDYEVQAEEEKKQLDMMKEHYTLLLLRSKKLNKCSKFFQKYFFRDIKDKKKLRSNRLEKIDTMDDLDNVEDIDEVVENMDLAATVTRIKKDSSNDNPLATDIGLAKTLEKTKVYTGASTGKGGKSNGAKNKKEEEKADPRKNMDSSLGDSSEEESSKDDATDRPSDEDSNSRSEDKSYSRSYEESSG